MRSAIRSCRARWRLSTPSTWMRWVPAPSMRAPIAARHRARSHTSGSRAAFTIFASPRPGAALRSRAEFLHQPQQVGDVEEIRGVADLERLGAEQHGRNLRQGGILGPVNLHRSLELVATADYKPVHPKPFMEGSK